MIYTLEIKGEAICSYDAADALQAVMLLDAGWFREDLLSLQHADGRPLWDGKSKTLNVRMALPDEAAAFQAELVGHFIDDDAADAGDLISFLVPLHDSSDEDECLDDVCIECRLAGK